MTVELNVNEMTICRVCMHRKTELIPEADCHTPGALARHSVCNAVGVRPAFSVDPVGGERITPKRPWCRDVNKYGSCSYYEKKP